MKNRIIGAIGDGVYMATLLGGLLIISIIVFHVTHYIDSLGKELFN